MEKTIDPKFKLACDEIAQILLKYDLGASIFLASEKGNHWLHEWTTPSWSSFFIEKLFEGHIAIRLRAKGSDPAEKDKLEKTLSMLLSFRDQMVNSIRILNNLENQLSKQIEIQHVSQIDERGFVKDMREYDV